MFEVDVKNVTEGRGGGDQLGFGVLMKTLISTERPRLLLTASCLLSGFSWRLSSSSIFSRRAGFSPVD